MNVKPLSQQPLTKGEVIKCQTSAQGYALINGRWYQHPHWPPNTQVWVYVLPNGQLFDAAIQPVSMESVHAH